MSAVPEMVVRPVGPADLGVVQRALYLAALWAGEDEQWPPGRVLAHEYFVMYHAGWGREGDVGVMAVVDGAPIGAAFGRLFTEEEHGHGFVDRDTPEIAIGVEPSHRGRGIGRALLTALADAYRRLGITAMSLSVENGNQAVRLYERAGFVTVRHDGNARVMLARLDVASRPASRPRAP